MTESRRLLGVAVALSAFAIILAAGVVIVVLVQDDDQNAAHPLTDLVASALDTDSETHSEVAERQPGMALTAEHRAYADDLVEEGTITEKQAEELLDWWAQAPEWVGSIQRSDDREDLEYTFRFAPFAEFRGDSEATEPFGWSEDFDFEGLFAEDFADRLDDWLSELEDASPQYEQGESELEPRFSFGRRFFGEVPEEFGDSNRSEWLDDLFEEGLIPPEASDEIREWLKDLPDSFEFGMEGFPGDGSFEFDSDDGKFRFRGHWRMDESEWDSDNDGGSKDDRDNGDGISFTSPKF